MRVSTIYAEPSVVIETVSKISNISNVHERGELQSQRYSEVSVNVMSSSGY